MNNSNIDLLNQKNYIYQGENLERYGLYIELNPWNAWISVIFSK